MKQLWFIVGVLIALVVVVYIDGGAN